MTALRAVPSEPPRTVLRSDAEPEPLAVAPVAERAAISTRIVIARVLITLAVLVAWLVAYLLFLSRLEESRDQRALYLQFRSDLAAGLTPVAQPIATGKPIALLSIPDADVSGAVVVEGTTAQQLQRGPGHLRGTVLPGQAGVSVLFGRSVSYGAPFGSLSRLRPGQTLSITTGQGTFHYRVEDLRRHGDPLPPALGPKDGRLTMVTASGGISAGATLYVDARLMEKAQPASGTAVGAASDEQPFASQTDLSTLVELAFGLQAVIVVLLAATWLRHRWRPLAGWIVCAPAVLATVWFTTGAAARLLPNLV